MAKEIAKSIRLSREVFEYIDGYRGNGFNEKFENIILDYQKVEKDLQARIKARKKELDIWTKRVNAVAEIVKNLESMKWRVNDCLHRVQDISIELRDISEKDVSQL